MKISVWDTYVKREDGQTMHFDILVSSDLTDEQAIYAYGLDYLETKSFKVKQLTSKECKFCHIESAKEEMIEAIEENGYTIIEMENCS